jgi:hypothetical protein
LFDGLPTTKGFLPGYKRIDKCNDVRLPLRPLGENRSALQKAAGNFCLAAVLRSGCKKLYLIHIRSPKKCRFAALLRRISPGEPIPQQPRKI